MKIRIEYENDDYKATIPLKVITDLFEMTDEQINQIKKLVLEEIRRT